MLSENRAIRIIAVSVGLFAAFHMSRECLSQTLSPVDPSKTPHPKLASAQKAPNERENKARPKKPDWLFPLFPKDPEKIQSFYGRGWLSGPTQIKFLYGFGQGTKSLSADLATMIFPNGIITTIGSSVTASSNSNRSGGQNTHDTTAQAIDRLKTGGDFYIQAAYPLVAEGNDDNQLSVFSISKLGFNISGLGSEGTITESTEHNFNSSLEAYAQYAALPGSSGEKFGKVYGDVRIGWQNVQSGFADSVGLAHRNFVLAQLAAGLQFGEFMRIGVQRYFGPAQAFNISKNELSKWHVVLEFIPPRPPKQ